MKPKAIIIFFISCFFIPAGYAQYDTIDMADHDNSFKPYTVDTLPYGNPYYLFPFVDKNDLEFFLPTHMIIGAGWLLPYVADTPTTVYGIAASAAYGMETIGNAYYLLVVKDQAGNWQYIDTAERYGYNVVSTLLYDDTIFPNKIWTSPCYEYYFDHPHILRDTFYVGIIPEYYWNFLDSLSVKGYVGTFNLPQLNHLRSRYMYHPWLGGWVNYELPYDNDSSAYLFEWPGLYPIIQSDRLLCGGPGGLRLVERGSDYASIAWGGNRPFDDLYSRRYQVSAGPLYTPPDSNNIITVSDSTAVVTGLDSGFYLAAWVRSECDHQCPNHDTLLWSQWSSPLVFYVGAYAPGEASIQTPLAADISLSPNPATDVVRVESGERKVESIEVVDMLGRVVLRKQLPAPVSSLLIDTSPLPSGSYLLRIYTREGIVNKRLSLTP
jgi:hypothetical protein